MAFILDNNDLAIIAQDVSMASDFATIAHNSAVFDMGAIQAKWTGANTTAALVIPEASVDGENWCSIYRDADQKKIDKPSGCLIYSIDNITWRFTRVRFEHKTNTAGTITIYSFLKRRRANNP